MDQTLIIFGSIALASVAILCVTLAVVAVRAGKNLERLTVTMEHVGSDVAQIRERAVPLIEETTLIVRRADGTLARLDQDLARLSRGTEMVVSMAEDVRDLERQLVAKVRGPLEDLASLFSGALRGLTSFTKSLLDR